MAKKIKPQGLNSGIAIEMLGLEAWLPSTKPKENRTKLEQIFDKHNATNFWGINRSYGQIICVSPGSNVTINNTVGTIIKYTGNPPSYVKKP